MLKNIVRNGIFKTARAISGQANGVHGISSKAENIVNKYIKLQAELEQSSNRIDDISDVLLQDDNVSEEFGQSCKNIIDNHTALQKEFKKVCDELKAPENTQSGLNIKF